MTASFPPVLTVYGALWCPDCTRAKAYLDREAVPYIWIDIDTSDEAAATVERLNNGMRSIPTIVFPDGSTLVEPSNDELAARLHTPQLATSSDDEVRSLVIIGSGPSGYTAALYAARANLRPLVYTGYQYGGQLTLTTEVENYPGFRDGIMGPELMEAMRAQAERFGAELRDRDVTAIDLSQHPFTITAGDEVVRAAAVIIATGASAKWLDVPGESDYRGYGVSSCATCDGAFFRNRRIVVVGGGDVALEEATFLTRYASEVTVVHRRETLRASKAMQERAQNNPKIRFLYNSVVEEVVGERDAQNGIARVTGLRLRDLTQETVSLVPTDALFVAIGHHPNTAFLAGQLPLDDHGYLQTLDGDGTATVVPGVFVAGDVRDFRYRQAITAAGDGCKAAIDAERWLEEFGVDTGAALVEAIETQPLLVPAR